jgi:hypothetical protein
MKTLPKNAGQLTLAPVFFVLVRIGENHPDDAYPAAKQWEDAYQIVSDRVMELLDTDKALAASVRKNSGNYLLVFVEEETFEERKGFGSHGTIRQNLQVLISEAMSHLASPRRGSLLAEAPGRGQLFATVLRVEDEDAARTYCEQAKGGEVSLPNRREESDNSRADRIRAVLSKARPTGYLAAVNEAKELVSLTKQEIIARITPLLNAQVSAMPSENYGDKQKIASWVNGELRRLGLAIRCPKTNHPAILVADVRGGEHEISRFRLEIRDDSGNRKRTWSSQSIPELTLMEDSPREEPIAKWSARLRQKRQDNQRE